MIVNRGSRQRSERRARRRHAARMARIRASKSFCAA
jgi:hypothetical protein